MPGQCTYCGTRLKRSSYSTDHVIPRVVLNRTKVTITDRQRYLNRVPCCIGCNNRKADMDPRDWIAYIHDERRRTAFIQLLETLPVTAIYEAQRYVHYNPRRYVPTR